MALEDPPHIVADGQRRIRETEGYRLQEPRVRAAVAHRCQPELAPAGPLRRASLRLRMWWEIREELQS